MNDKRKYSRENMIENLTYLLYDSSDLKNIIHLIKLDYWSDRLLDKTHEW